MHVTLIENLADVSCRQNMRLRKDKLFMANNMLRKIIRDFIDDKKEGPILEIGPLTTPFLSKDTYNVHYADIRDKDEIYNAYNLSYKGSGEELYNKIVPIDFVIKNTYLNAVGEMKFLIVFSSHVIEHTHDLLGHLLDIGDILLENGYFVMLIPDKKNTFDRNREVTPFRDVLDVYLSINKLQCTARFGFDFLFTASFKGNPISEKSKGIIKH